MGGRPSAAATGRCTVGEKAWTGNSSFKSRFEDGVGTNPEELLAAFARRLLHDGDEPVPHEKGSPPDSLDTTVKTHLRQVEGAPTITKAEIEVTAASRDRPGPVPAVREQAKEQCVISRALAGVQEMTVTATCLANRDDLHHAEAAWGGFFGRPEGSRRAGSCPA
jgi:osmotically inducible protein OsmC